MKTQLKNEQAQVFLHNKHIDINIDMECIPFDVRYSEKLNCAVKGLKSRLGTKVDGMIYLFICKNDNKKEINKVYEEEIISYIKKIKRMEKEILRLKERIKNDRL